MFREPITEITFEKVEDFCKEELPEGIRFDYKEDFPKDLAKTIAAFANTYGGLILIGVEETDRSTPKLPIKGIPLQRGLNERVTAIALRGIYPPVFPETKVCEFSAKGAGEPDRAVVVIRVQESSDTPHAIENKTKVYIRVDKQDEPYGLAEVDQIIALASRRKEAVENRQRMIGNAFERCWNVRRAIMGSKPTIESPSVGLTIITTPHRTVSIVPLFPHESLTSLDSVYDIAREQDPDHYLHVGSPKPVQGGIIFEPYPTEDMFNYMELNQQGLVFYLENLYEDTVEGYSNSVWIERTIRVIGKVIEYALYCYENIGFWGLVKVELSLSNILGRRLSQNIESRGKLPVGCICPDRDIQIEATKSISELEKDGYLTTVGDFVKNFTWAFGLKLSPEAVKNYVETTLAKH